jgi:CubicO group peptidase (beta-lactamase class C family)
MILAFALLLAGTLGRYDAKTPSNHQAQAADTALMRRVDSVFVAWSRTSTPGCAVGVDTGGVPLLRRAYGMANLETATPWTVGTISESGSVAKQFTATALVLLARDGVLSLDDDITRWIPEAKGVGRKITIRHLLTHTSGFPDRYLLHEVEGRPAGAVDHPNAEVLDVVSRLRNLNFDPGEDYLYSNTGFILAATVVERASGHSLQKFTDVRMFRPLGMSSTRWREDHRDVVPGRASAYSGNPIAGFRNDHPFTRVIGSGGLNTTVGDFLKWQAALQKGEAPWGAVRDSLERVGRLNDGTELTYALGLTVDRWRGLRRVSHTGSTGGYRAALYRYPDQNVAVALLCNGGAINPGDIAARVSALVLGSSLAAVDPEPAAAPVDAAALSGLVGIYRAPRTGEVMILSVREGRLSDSTTGNATLTPIGSGTFKYRNSARTITVVPGAAGAPAGLRVRAPNTRTVEYQAVERPRLDAAALAAYAGEYASPELGARYRLVLRSDTLLLDQGWRGSERLRPIYRDGFRLGDVGIATFTRDSRGRITGFEIWAGRVRHLRFDRIPAR